MINWFDKKSQLPNISFKERCMHMSWCLKNDITIFFILQSWNIGFLRINDKGKLDDYCDEKGILVRYKQTKLKINDKVWGKKVYELYSEYYIKYNPEWVSLKTIKENDQRAKLRKQQGFTN